MASSAQQKFRIDTTINDLVTNSRPALPEPPTPKEATLPEPMFPQHPERSLIAVPNRLPNSATGAVNTLCARCADG